MCKLAKVVTDFPLMARRSIDAGPTGKTVATNIARFRGQRGLTLAGLAERMTEVGRPMSVSGISSMENMQRRVDVDDLVAFAAALNVSPAALLMPHVTADNTHDPSDPSLLPKVPLETSAEPKPSSGTSQKVTAGQFWLWLTADSPLNEPIILNERDEVAVEAWRREQVPAWAYRSGEVNRGR